MTNTYKKLQVIRLTTDFEKAVEIVEDAIPTPKEGQVLVRTLYAGVNAGDVNVTAGRYFVPARLPFDVGFESVGIVEAVGDNTAFKPGDSVFYFGFQGYSQYVLVRESELMRLQKAKPEYLALGVSGLTASIGLEEVAHIRKQDKVLITVAAGGTGHIAVQWAKSKGCHVIGVCSMQEKAEYLYSIGCNFVINHKKDNITELLHKHYPRGIDVIWEAYGGDIMITLFKHLAKNGRMIVVGAITGYRNDGYPQVNFPNLTEELILGSKQILGFLLLNSRDKFPDYWHKLLMMYKRGEIKVKIDMGVKSESGPFKGLDSVAKAVNVLTIRNCNLIS